MIHTESGSSSPDRRTTEVADARHASPLSAYAECVVVIGVRDAASRRRQSADLARFLRPALWVHLLRRLNAESYAHVEPRRLVRGGDDLQMAPTVSLRNGERIECGARVHVGERCSVWAGNSTGRIVLEDDVVLAPNVFLTASDYGTALGSLPRHQPKRERDITVGAGAWLGAGVIVVAGVTIGPGVVVAAGAVVTRDLPPDCIAAGVPARVVGQRSSAEQPRG